MVLLGLAPQRLVLVCLSLHRHVAHIESALPLPPSLKSESAQALLVKLPSFTLHDTIT